MNYTLLSHVSQIAALIAGENGVSVAIAPARPQPAGFETWQASETAAVTLTTVMPLQKKAQTSDSYHCSYFLYFFSPYNSQIGWRQNDTCPY